MGNSQAAFHGLPSIPHLDQDGGLMTSRSPHARSYDVGRFVDRRRR
jgi:hypothetical protein